MFVLGFVLGAIFCFMMLFIIGVGIQNKKYNRAIHIIESVKDYDDEDNLRYTQQRYES